MLKTPSSARWLIATGCTLIAACAITAWWLIRPGTGKPQPPSAVSSIDTEHRACLITSPDGNPAEAQTAWTGLLHTAHDHPAIVIQRYTLPPGADPSAYLNTLASMRCDTIVTVGAALHDALASQAPETAHYIVIDDRPLTTIRTTTIPPAQSSPATIEAAITSTTTH